MKYEFILNIGNNLELQPYFCKKISVHPSKVYMS